jgi:signal transduction histidine kinase
MKVNGPVTSRIAAPFLILALLLAHGHAADAAASLPLKRVLLLYSEQRDHPAHELTDRGIRGVFRSNRFFDVEVYAEYLDAARFAGISRARAMADYLRGKYFGIKINAIITVYPYAMDFLLAERRSLLPEVPIVAAVMTRGYGEKLERSPARRFVTGTIIGDNIFGIMEAALRMKPKTKRVALVAGTTANDRYGELIFRRGLKAYEKKIEMIDLTKLPMEEIVDRVGSLPADTIVLYSGILRDGTGKMFVPREALSLISAAASAPVFGLYDSYMGYGIVGGRLASFELEGREAAALAIRVMGGESPGSIPFEGGEAYVDLYDWRELKRWNIPESAILPGSEILYREASVWVEHRGAILGGVSFIILESLFIIVLFVNLHRRKQAESEAEQHRNELAHVTRMATMGEFTSSLAHELNQPLTAIRNYASAAGRFLSQGEPDLGRAREALAGIIRGDRRAAEVIRRIREFLKKEESRLLPLNMNHVIQGILAFIRRDSILEGVAIETDLAPGLPAVRGDRVQLQQVLLNLLLNAVEATNKAEPDLRKVVVRTENGEGRGVKVSVRDFGSGIEEAHLGRVFEPFYTTKPGGMGMGLRISARIIHAHGGEIRAENNPDRGATFYFILAAGTEGKRPEA